LARKHVVTRRKIGRSFVYTPALTRDDVRTRAVRELVESLFDGREDFLRSFLNGRPANVAVTPEHDEPPRLDATLL
jgi:predicted transcriptional regulator